MPLADSDNELQRADDDVAEQDHVEREEEEGGGERFSHSTARLRVLALVSVLYGCATLIFIGNLYAFSTYGPELKQALGYTQEQVSEITSIGDWGLYIGVTLGSLYDAFGPEITSIVSSACIFLGYFLMYGATMKWYSVPPPVVGFFLAIAAQGCIGTKSLTLLSNMSNFRAAHRGKVSGLLSACYGISAAVITLFHALPAFNADTTGMALQNFLLFLAVVPALLVLGGAFFQNRIGDIPAVELGVSEGTGLLSGHAAMRGHDDRDQHQTVKDSSGIQSTSVTVHAHIDYDVGFRGLLRDVRAYVLLLLCVFVHVPGILWINNVGFIAESMSIDTSVKDSIVILLSVCNATGRLAFGFLSDAFWIRFGTPRHLWFLAAGTLHMVGYIVMFVSPNTATVLVATVLVGLSYGGASVLIPCTVRDMFGSTHLGFNYGLVQLGSGIGTSLFGIMAGHIYDEHVDDPDAGKCHGVECFELTYLVVLCVCIGICALSVLLVWTHARWLVWWTRKNRVATVTVLSDTATVLASPTAPGASTVLTILPSGSATVLDDRDAPAAGVSAASGGDAEEQEEDDEDDEVVTGDAMLSQSPPPPQSIAV